MTFSNDQLCALTDIIKALDAQSVDVSQLEGAVRVWAWRDDEESAVFTGTVSVAGSVRQDVIV